MKKMWIGVGLLVLLFGMGIFMGWWFPTVHDPVGQQLRQAQESCLAGDWQETEQAFYAAKLQWEKYRDITAMLCDHDPQDQMETLFAEAEVYCRTRDGEHFPPTCARLAAMSDAMEDLHRLNLPNLF